MSAASMLGFATPPRRRIGCFVCGHVALLGCETACADAISQLWSLGRARQVDVVVYRPGIDLVPVQLPGPIPPSWVSTASFRCDWQRHALSIAQRHPADVWWHIVFGPCRSIDAMCDPRHAVRPRRWLVFGVHVHDDVLGRVYACVHPSRRVVIVRHRLVDALHDTIPAVLHAALEHDDAVCAARLSRDPVFHAMYSHTTLTSMQYMHESQMAASALLGYHMQRMAAHLRLMSASDQHVLPSADEDDDPWPHHMTIVR